MERERTVEQAAPGTLLDAEPAPSTTPDDGVLIAAVRSGDTDAYGELFARHADAARRLARAMTDPVAADDLVSEAFAKVLVVLQRGAGPDLAFRPYLLTAVRRLHVDSLRATGRVRPTEDQDLPDLAAPIEDTAVAGFERSAAARALASLPERWQAVLWHTEVEGQKPAEIAPLLGMSPNAVAALAYRAREALRQAFLTMHVEDAGEEACATARANLGAYVRGALAHREATKLAAHLESCRPCAAIYLELVEVNGELRSLLAPVVLGSAAAAYLGSASGFSFSGLTGVLAGMVKPMAGVAAAGVAAAGLVVAIGTHNGEDATGRGPGGADHVIDGGSQPRTLHRTEAQRSQSAGAGVPTAVAGSAPQAPEPGPQAQSIGPRPTPAPASSAPGPGHSPASPAGSASTSGQVNLSVAASATSNTGLEWDVEVRIAGLASDQTATLTIGADHPSVNVQLDPSCDPVGAGNAVCEVQGPSVLRLVVLPDPTHRTTLTFTVTPGPGLDEVNGDDNVTRVTLAR
jgi:RNA polymerase sigma factor (sigma-70 family)